MAILPRINAKPDFHTIAGDAQQGGLLALSEAVIRIRPSRVHPPRRDRSEGLWAWGSGRGIILGHSSGKSRFKMDSPADQP
jgi:hypothetical protein